MKVKVYVNYLAVLGAVLAILRKRLGKRQQEMTLFTGIPNSTLSRYENGDTPMDVAVLHRICKSLNVTTVDFYIYVHQVTDVLTEKGIEVNYDGDEFDTTDAIQLMQKDIIRFYEAKR